MRVSLFFTQILLSRFNFKLIYESFNLNMTLNYFESSEPFMKRAFRIDGPNTFLLIYSQG